MTFLLDEDLMAQVWRIELRARRAVSQELAGAWRSSFHGRGIEFAEVREYQDGDSLAMVDWHLTARFGTPYVKLFTEERQQGVFLLVDGSASIDFGSAGQTKRAFIAELAAVLALSANQAKDRVGLMIFTDAEELHVRPAMGDRHALRMVRDLLTFTPRSHATDLAKALRGLCNAPMRRSIVFVISDLHSANFQAELSRLAQRHEVVVLDTLDPLELDLPRTAPLALVDLESGATARLGGRAQRSFGERNGGAREELRTECRRLGVDVAELVVGEDFVPVLGHLFDRRQVRR